MKAGDYMTDSHGALSPARTDLELLIGDLHGLSGQLQELATISRRLDLPGALRLEPGSPDNLRDAIARLEATLRGLVDTGSGQVSGLASSATTQMSALDAGVRAAIAEAEGSPSPGGAAGGASPGSGLVAMLEMTLDRIGPRLASLIQGVAFDRTAQHDARQG
jgi:hypothetical protein